MRFVKLKCLQYLVELNLAENYLTNIETIGNLFRLQKLNLSGNQIQRIPSSVSRLQSLTHLKLQELEKIKNIYKSTRL